jgi:methylthioribulose-1-phosphate dehydratase
MTDFASAAAALIAAGARFDQRGWAPATAGNYSVRLDDGSIAITVSGAHKGRLGADAIMRVDGEGRALDSKKPSAETLLHCLIYAIDPTARAVVHTHSVAGTVLSRAVPGAAIALTGYEVLKALPGIDTHDTTLALPLVENTQDMPALAEELRPLLLAQSPQTGTFYIRGHGLYAWGRDLVAAENGAEAIEFLLACAWEEWKVR